MRGNKLIEFSSEVVRERAGNRGSVGWGGRISDYCNGAFLSKQVVKICGRRKVGWRGWVRISDKLI